MKLMEFKMKFIVIFCLVGLLVLNMLDAIFTIYALDAGLAWELNPLARIFLNLGNEWFVVWKALQVGLCVLIFWKWRNYKLAKFGMAICLFIYTILIAWHKWGV